jgi:hypothetical protein
LWIDDRSNFYYSPIRRGSTHPPAPPPPPQKKHFFSFQCTNHCDGIRYCDSFLRNANKYAEWLLCVIIPPTFHWNSGADAGDFFRVFFRVNLISKFHPRFTPEYAHYNIAPTEANVHQDRHFILKIFLNSRMVRKTGHDKSEINFLNSRMVGKTQEVSLAFTGSNPGV